MLPALVIGGSIFFGCSLLNGAHALELVKPDSSLALCPGGGMPAGLKLPSFSQLGEDQKAITLLGPKVGGTFIETGAYNGLYMSNTKLLEYAFGWSGLLVEMVPKHFHELRQYRSERSVPLHSAVCEGAPRMLNFSEAIGSSSVEDRQVQTARQQRRTSKVPCDSLGAMARRAGLEAVDFMSIDVEGYELEVLRSFDWTIPVSVVVVEVFQLSKETLQAVVELLRDKGHLEEVDAGACAWRGEPGKSRRMCKGNENKWFVSAELAARYRALPAAAKDSPQVFYDEYTYVGEATTELNQPHARPKPGAPHLPVAHPEYAGVRGATWRDSLSPGKWTCPSPP
mmetsp:Transcript_30910/g.69437  ORF Transcript_30910/g.69437 Transcript_30910/m.69437 type:complete len:340 (+) Transcript_30910:178-1197(+)